MVEPRRVACDALADFLREGHFSAHLRRARRRARDARDALVDVLCGRVSPSGRLAFSVPFDLSEARFKAGVDNYLTVLDAQRSLYAAQQTLIGLRQAEQVNRVTLWKVLGGTPDAG